MSHIRETNGDRGAGRAFDDPNRPLGEHIATHDGATDIPERAKVVAILRKAEEFMQNANPPPVGQGVRRALELAAGRMGLDIAEYDRIVKADPELQALETKVLQANIA